MRSGVDELWKQLIDSDLHQICERAGAGYRKRKELFTVTCFNEKVEVSVAERRIHPLSWVGTLLRDRFEEAFTLSLLAYLVYARGGQVSGELVKPSDLPGGHIYREGSHRLPLSELAACYRDNSGKFLRVADRLGGRQLDYGDASSRLYPYPRLPVTLVLWERDDEFPERADLFFDTSSRNQFPPDVLWSVASMSILLLIELSEQEEGKA